MQKRAQARQIPVHKSRGYKEANDDKNRDQLRVFRSARINERGYYTRFYKDKEADGEVKQRRVACFNGTHNDDGTHDDEDYDDGTHDDNDDGDWTPHDDDGDDWTHNDGDDDDGTDHDDDDGTDHDDDGTHHVTPPIMVYTRSNKTTPLSDGVLQDYANNISKRVELSCCTVPPPLPQQAVKAGQPFPRLLQPCDITQSEDDASISSSGEWKSPSWGDKKCREHYRKQYKVGRGMLRENTNKAGNGGWGMPGADSKRNTGVEDCGLLMSSRVQEPNNFSNMQDFGTGSRSAQWQQQQHMDIHNCNYMKLLQLVQHKQPPRECNGQSSNTTASHVQEDPQGTSTTFSAEHSATPHSPSGSPSAAISHQPVPLSTVLEALPNDFTDSELVISPPEVQSTNTTVHRSKDPQRQPHICPSLYSELLQKPAIIHQPFRMQTEEVTTEECEEKEDTDLYTEPNQKPKRKKHRPKVIRDISKTKTRRVLKSTEKKVRMQGGIGLQDGGQKHLPKKQSTKEEYHVFESTVKCPLRVTKKKRTLRNRRPLYANNRAITKSSCIVNRQDKEPGGIGFQFSALLNQFSKGQDQLASDDILTHVAEGQVIYLHDMCSAFSRELPHGKKFAVYTHLAENQYSERIYSAEAIKCPQENYLALYSQLSDQHELLDTRDSELPLCLPSAADTSSTASNEFSLVQRSFTQLLLAQEPDNNLQMVVYDQKREMVVSKSTKPPEKIRAKVQMDIENERMWPLLALGGVPTDFEDPQYWEKERAVMKRRIELFIHRMHSVQGDRGFSPWKGSMVDSVVGAFLTQNVSDHLSSSAFMSVASRYPPAQSNDTGNASPPETNETPCCEMQSDMEDLQRAPPGLVEEKPLDKQGDIDTTSLNDHGSTTVEFDICGINATCTELSDNKRLCSSLCGVKTDLKITEEACDDTSASSPLKTRDLDYKRSANAATEEDCNFIEEDCSGDHKVMEKGWQVSHQRTEVYRSNTVCRTLFTIDAAKHQGSKDAEQANSEIEVSALNAHDCSHHTEFQLTMIQESNKQVDLEFDMVHDTEAPLPVPKTVGKKRHISLSSISGIERAHLEENMKGRKKNHNQDWESIRKQTLGLRSGAGNPCKQHPREDTHQDSVDWEAVRRASVEELAETIKERGMHHVLSGRIKAFLKTLQEEHGSINLEWLRKVSPENAKAYLMSIHGLGVKSVECIRLLTLHHVAFPVDVNVGRICVRLGWVPIEPLPEELQLHLLELYPVQETIQKYLWPRLCTLDQKTLYEFHYQLITFGKVFCTKSKPNCNSCPMRTECKHFASAYASAKLLLTGPKDGQHNKICSAAPVNALTDPHMDIVGTTLVEYVEDNLIKDPLISEIDCTTINSFSNDHIFYIEEPASPEQTHEQEIMDLEDFPYIYKNLNDFTDDLLTAGNLSKPTCISMNGQVSCTYEEDMKSFDTQSSSTHAEVDASHKYSTPERPCSHSERDRFGANGGLFATPSPLCSGYQSVGDTPPERPSSCESTIIGEAPKAIEEAPNAIIPLPGGAHIPAPKLKNVNRLRTVHYVYELPDTHPLLEKVDAREKDDPCSYLLAIWSPGETPESPQEINELFREDSHTSSDANADETISGTLLIPCRTAMQGSFPLNGTYFQVNEVFADHESSLQPFQVSRSEIWKLQRRFVYFGTSVPNIFRGLTTPEIKSCFLRGHVCVRGFDRHTRAPKPLVCRLHFPISKQQKGKKAPKAEN